MRGLYPRRQTPHPPPLRSGTFSHKGRREVVLRFLTVIASAAKQSISLHNEWMDCFVAIAPRNDENQFGFGGASAARTCQNFRRRRALSTVSLPYCTFAFGSSWRAMVPAAMRLSGLAAA